MCGGETQWCFPTKTRAGQASNSVIVLKWKTPASLCPFRSLSKPWMPVKGNSWIAQPDLPESHGSKSGWNVFERREDWQHALPSLCAQSIWHMNWSKTKAVCPGWGLCFGSSQFPYAFNKAKKQDLIGPREISLGQDTNSKAQTQIEQDYWYTAAGKRDS